MAKSQKRKVRKPSWLADVPDQKEWTARFAKKLKEYERLDSTISAILHNEWVLPRCAAKIRAYTDKSVMAYLHQSRKQRGRMMRANLETAIEGINAAIDLYADRGNQDVTMYLGTLAIELSAMLGRCNQAFATKRHGRHYDHSFLLECRKFLEGALQCNITYVTLANLINAANETDGETGDVKATEEHVRKNLTAFQKNKNNLSIMKLISG
jgi:hypothetical protein